MIKMVINEETDTVVELVEVGGEIIMSVATDELDDTDESLWDNSFITRRLETSIVLPKSQAIALAKQLNMLAQSDGPSKDH